MAEELYKKYRPQKFSDVIGQDDALRSLAAMGKSNSVPHAILFTGPSGCGKTTLARILRTKLKCSNNDFYELNAADSRGIDMVRDIRSRMGLSPVGGETRVWLIDECHQLTAQAQEALLKILEDTPSHVYFFLASTDPQQLKKTIITRCTEIKVSELSPSDISNLVSKVYKAETEKEVPEEITKKIADICEGSARKALVLLHQIIGVLELKQQLEILQKADTKRQAIEICRALLNEKTDWSVMKTVLKEVTEDAESIRWMVLGYMSSTALKGGGHIAKRAVECIVEFEEPFYNSKKAGLTRACFLLTDKG